VPSFRCWALFSPLERASAEDGKKEPLSHQDRNNGKSSQRRVIPSTRKKFSGPSFGFLSSIFFSRKVAPPPSRRCFRRLQARILNRFDMGDDASENRDHPIWNQSSYKSAKRSGHYELSSPRFPIMATITRRMKRAMSANGWSQISDRSTKSFS